MKGNRRESRGLKLVTTKEEVAVGDAVVKEAGGRQRIEESDEK